MGLITWAEDNQTLLLILLLSLTAVYMFARAKRRDDEDILDTSKVGNITVEELSKYCGVDPFRPLYLAVRSVIFDVTDGKDFYGPKGPYEVFAGRECAKALAKMSKDEVDCTADLSGLSDREFEILCDWEVKFRKKYPVVGQVVPSKQLTLQQLLQHSGQDPSVPIYLAIKGTIFDVSSGKEFYGPDGMYPFAGHECARAFAMFSTDTADCNDNLEGLEKMELESLHDWQAKFYSKYPIVGSVVA